LKWVDFRWLGHSTVLVPGSTTIAVDPWRWRDEKTKVDVVLITHGHADHCSEDDLAAASHESTKSFGPESISARMRAAAGSMFCGLREGDEVGINGVRILALPAQGPPRAVEFHPRGDGLSFLLETQGARYLFLGDSVALPEHAGLAPDVAFFAVGGLATMDPAEAADAAAVVKPALAVPIHWGDLNGRFDLASRFATLCAERGIRAEIKPTKE
jgi:L-ascorbate metabolism protein UlaG (beta-lactamase superfamily)